MKFRALQFYRGSNFPFSIDCFMGLTTMQCYYAACDVHRYTVESCNKGVRACNAGVCCQVGSTSAHGAESCNTGVRARNTGVRDL